MFGICLFFETSELKYAYKLYDCKKRVYRRSTPFFLFLLFCFCFCFFFVRLINTQNIQIVTTFLALLVHPCCETHNYKFVTIFFYVEYILKFCSALLSKVSKQILKLTTYLAHITIIAFWKYVKTSFFICME